MDDQCREQYKKCIAVMDSQLACMKIKEPNQGTSANVNVTTRAIGCQTAETDATSHLRELMEAALKDKEKEFESVETCLRGKIRWLQFVVRQTREDRRAYKTALDEAKTKIKCLQDKLHHAKQEVNVLEQALCDQDNALTQIQLDYQVTLQAATSQNISLQQKLDVCITAYTEETSRLYEESQLLWSEAQSLSHKLNGIQVQAHSYKMELDRCRYNAEYELQIVKEEKSRVHEKMMDLEQQKIAMCLDLQQCYATMSYLHSLLYHQEHDNATQLRIQLAERDSLVDKLHQDLQLQQLHMLELCKQSRAFATEGNKESEETATSNITPFT